MSILHWLLLEGLNLNYYSNYLLIRVVQMSGWKRIQYLLCRESLSKSSIFCYCSCQVRKEEHITRDIYTEIIDCLTCATLLPP